MNLYNIPATVLSFIANIFFISCQPSLVTFPSWIFWDNKMHFKEDTDALKLTFDQETVFLQLQYETDLESELIPLAFCSLCSLLLLIEQLLLVHIVPRSLVAGAAFPERGFFFTLYHRTSRCRMCWNSRNAGSCCWLGCVEGAQVLSTEAGVEWRQLRGPCPLHGAQTLLSLGGMELQLMQLGCWMVPDEARALQLFPSSEETPDNSTPRGLWALCFGSLTEEDS